MPSLRAWEQGSGEPTYRQVVQGPLGHSAREGLHPDVTDLIVEKGELLELWERPLPIWAWSDCLSKGRHASIANGVTFEGKRLKGCQRPLGHSAREGLHLSLIHI